MVIRVLLCIAPFAAALVLIYVLLLSDYDINYYLSNRPPVFWLAGILAGLVVLILVIVLARLLIGWVYALPLVLFGDAKVSDALHVSRRLVQGRRISIAAWLIGWFIFSTLVFSLAVMLIDAVGDAVVPGIVDRLGWLVIALGTILLGAGLINLLIDFVNSSLLSLLIVRLYREAGFSGQKIAPEPAWSSRLLRLRGMRLSLRGLVWSIAAATAVIILIGVLVLQQLKLTDHVQVIAHRGAAAAAPENTLAAVEQAIADGADWIEIDVQRTADDEVVVIHDSDLKKIAGLDLKIRDSNYADLSAIDIGSWFSPDFSDQRLPTLRRVLETARDRAGVLIELKYYGDDPRLAERVIAIVESMDPAPPVQLMSLQPRAVQQIRSLRPDWKVGLLSSVNVGDITRLDVDFLALNAAFVDRALIRRVHRQGKQILVWTVNEPAAMLTMLGRGVDGMITDHPAAAVSLLQQRAELSPPERLLLQLAGLFGRELQYPEQ
jgi:glycerophosphoryl diester phosphodiesterase